MPETRLTALDELIARAAKGDRAAFDGLYDLTSARLYALLLSLLRDRPEAEAVLQRIYVAIWRGNSGAPQAGQSAWAWLIAYARDAALEHRRDLPPRATGDLPRLSGVSDDHASAVLDGTFAQLDPVQAEVLRAIYLQGLTYEDLALREDVPLEELRQWLRRTVLKVAP